MRLPDPLPSIGLLAVAIVALAGPTVAQEPEIAFVGATVLPMDGSPPLADATVLVRGDRIAAVGPRDSVAVGGGATVVDAAGAWLIPGLWDMHVHALFEAELAEPLLGRLVAHGVTGIRDMGGPLDVLAETQRGIASGDLPAPRIVASGPILDGPEPVHPEISWAIETPERGRAAVDSLAGAGVDFVKVYTMLPREAFFAVAEAARAHGLPLAGHVPASVSPVEAAEAGMRSIEHLRSEIEPFCTRADPAACEPAFAAFREGDVWQTPTLVVRRNRAFLDDSTTVYGPDVRHAPPMLRELWDGIRASRLARGPEYFEAARARHREERWLAGELHREGIGILAGSDAGVLFTPHGASLHDELALLVEAGLEPREALAAATSEAARFLGVYDSLGTIAPGKKADLVLLNADPLKDIAHTRRIRAVVIDGRVLDRAALDRLAEPPRAAPTGCEELVARVLQVIATRHHDATTRDRAASPVETPGESCAAAPGTREAVERALAPFDDPAIRLLDTDHLDRMIAEWSGLPVVGIGLSEVLSIDIDEGTGRLTVIAPVPGSPAAAAGLRAGDVVTRIDGTKTDGLGLTRAMERLRVNAGETVGLEVLGADGARRVVLTADSLPALQAFEAERVEDGDRELLLVRLHQFTPGVGEALGEAVASSAGVDAIVLDLRGNPGGFVDALVAVAGTFLEPDSEIARLTGPEPVELRVPAGSAPTRLPVSVLVDAGTASAAEALAAALRFHGRARIYGDRTFGKGLAHDVTPVAEGAWVLMLPVGDLETPAGERILGAGVRPDVRSVDPLARAIRDLRDRPGSGEASSTG